MMGAADRQALFAGTHGPSARASFDKERLERYLVEHLPGFSGPIGIAQFRGGQSNPTYRLDAQSGSFVLRRKPEGTLLRSAHAIEREYEVTKALCEVDFPVARPLLLCEDESVIGTAFYLMEHVEGRIYWEPHAPGLSAHDRKELFSSLNETIALLHMVDYKAIGLGGFGKAEGYVGRQVKRWTEQYRLSQTETIEEMERLIEWLPQVLPEQSQTALIHGDFRLDNCIIEARTPRVVAVLDWELSTIGDPIADFTYQLMQWHMPADTLGGGVGSLVGHEMDAPGLPTMDDYVAQYCERRGIDGIAHLSIYLAYNFFRLAAIFQGIAGRVRDGTAANPHAGLMGMQVKPMAVKAWEFAREAGR
ncbi:MAG TPA: phosphotransferase family protein [Aestuariivirgaceae bacterium]|jgi:aminoglycoside phosphotransferase (APT) family kinase protein